MVSIQLLAVMLFINWISTSNASTGINGDYSIDHVDRLDQHVNKSTGDNEGPKHGFPGLVVDYSIIPDVVKHVQDQVLVLVRVDNATAETLNSAVTTMFLPILYIIVFVMGLPANTIALWVFLFRIMEKHPSVIYMANLALSDILFAIWIPLKISYHFVGNDWVFGEGLCKVLVVFFYGNMYGSILFIACLSVQRYQVVVDPFSEPNNKMAIGVCVSIWVFIWTATVPLYQYDHTVRVEGLNITTCHDVTAIWDKNDPFASIRFPYYYVILMATVAFLIPGIVIVVAYVLMLWHLHKKMVCNVSSTSSKNRHRALVLIATVLVTFLVCFIPSNIMLVFHYYLLSIGDTNTCYDYYIITLCLASLNSCLDPFMYYFVSDDFRKHVKNTLLCRSRRTLDRIEYVEKHCRNSKSSGSVNTESSEGRE